MAKISKRTVEALSPGEIIADQEVRGFVARRLKSGKITYGFRYRDKTTSKQRWLGLGLHGTISPDQARDAAKAHAGAVAISKDPVTERKATRDKAKMDAIAEKNTVSTVLKAFIKKHASKNRSGRATEKMFDRHVYDHPIATKSIYDLTRRDVLTLRNDIDKNSGPIAADRTLANVRSAFNWWAKDDELFKSPIVEGMALVDPKTRRRKRYLDDSEIRVIWSALNDDTVPEAFRLLVRVLLLTAQRRTEVSRMHSREIRGDLWTIPADRAKNALEHVVPLSPEARRWIGNREGFLFSTTDGAKPFSGYSKAKKALDAVIDRYTAAANLDPIPNWRLHDLRRSARTLMSRAGVTSDIAERTLNHAKDALRDTYDRFQYLEEKRDALERVAGLVGQIVRVQ